MFIYHHIRYINLGARSWAAAARSTVQPRACSAWHSSQVGMGWWGLWILHTHTHIYIYTHTHDIYMRINQEKMDDFNQMGS
jgi:hypothetical protein